MAIIKDNFKYKKIKKNSFDSIQDTIINESVKAAKEKAIESTKNLHCRIHNQVPIVEVNGKSLETLDIKVLGCCSILKKKINQKLNSKTNLMGDFQEKAKEFSDGIRHHSFNDREFINNLQYELDIYRKPQHKVEFLENIVQAIESKLQDHEETCTATPETCHFSKTHRNAIFFTKEELDYQIANLIGTHKEGEEAKFSNDELKDVYSKIDIILEELNKLGLGQQIIFEEIESMKGNATKLNKKDFKMLFLGKVVGTGFIELLKNDTVQEFFEVDLPKLISGN